MPQRDVGRVTPKAKVKRKPVYGPPAPKAKPKPTVVAPADRVGERTAARAKQLKASVRKAGDAPQDRAADTKRANTYKKTDKYVSDVQKSQPTARRKAEVGVYKKGASPRDTLRKVLTTGAVSKPAPLAQAKSQQVVAAPVLKVLNQTTRPLHAVAAAAKEDVRTVKKEGVGHYLMHGTSGRGIKAAGRGIQNKDKTTFNDVFTEAGWKPKSGLGKFAKGAASLTADIGLDPTTYVTGGSGSIARKAAVDAGEKAAKKATKAGLSKEQAEAFRDRAAKQAAKTADQTTGVTIKVGGREVPGVRKATAKASKPARAAARKVVPKKVRSGVRNVAADVNPDITPVGVTREASRKGIQATRTARARTTQGERHAINTAHGIKHVIGEDNYARVVDAIEAGKIGKLPPELRGHAVTLRSQLRHVRKVQRRAGIPVPDRKGYVPRKLTQDALDEIDKKPVSLGKRSGKPSSSKARKETRPMSVLRDKKPGVYREDLHAVVAERLAEGTRHAAQASLNRDLGNIGTALKRGKAPNLAEGEAVYHLKAGNPPRQVTDKAEIARAVTPLRLNKAGTKIKGATPKSVGAGRYVVLPKEVVDRANEGIAPSLGWSQKGLVRGYDKVQSGFKKTALATVGFHVRNAIGDTSNAYVHQPGQKLPGNMVRAGRVLKAVGREDKAQRELGSAKVRIATNTKKGDRQFEQNRAILMKEEWTPRYFRDIKAEPGSSSRIKKRTDPAGGMEFWYTDARGHAIGYLYVSNGRRPGREVYVDPAHRRQGIATRLYAEAQANGMKTGNRNQRTAMGKAFTGSVTGKGRLKTKHYGNVTYEEAARNLIEAGAARSGYTSRELRELSGSGREGLKVPKAQAPGAVKRAFLNREDLPRLATAIHAVREGATWEEAAQKVADVHFDYAHLTQFERNVARRLAPFYTFTSRNVPLQAKRLVTNPGKYAAYQKVREEAANLSSPEDIDPKTRDLYKQLEASGVKLTGGWERYLSEFEQRNAGVPVKWKGRTFTVSAGLPLNDLNSLPGAAGGHQAREWLDKAASLVTPLVKDPAELGFNYSFFFRDQIQRDNSPLVNAPGFVAGWPDSAKRKLGVVRGQDKRTGEAVWKWPGKVDYVAHIPPGMFSQALKQATPGTDRTNRGSAAKVLGFAGIRAQPIDATSNAVNLAYARMNEIDKRQAALRQTRNPKNGLLISAKNPTPEYTRLALQRKVTLQIAYQGKTQREDAVLPTQGGPPKAASTGRVKVPGVGGRVRVPGAGGRVKVP